MTTLIKQRRITADTWRLLDPAAGQAGRVIPEHGDLIVPLALWNAKREQLLRRPYRNGVLLEGVDDPALIAPDLDCIAVVAVSFPKFADGRGYSTARLLRERYAYKGEVRAIGDVLHDQLPLLERCGFDAFALRDGQDPEAALRAFDDFSEAYQASATQPVPLFRRRSAAGAGGATACASVATACASVATTGTPA